MGNTPSSASKSHTPTPPSSSNVDTPRSTRKEHKNLASIHPHHIRSPASPEATTVQATGSTISSRSSHSRPLSILNSSSPTTSSNASPSQPRAFSPRNKHAVDIKPHDEPSKPVAVPQSHHEPAAFAQGSHLDEAFGGLGSNSTQDLSYHMARPPRLPLPIEEEIHTPGSPIAAAEDTDDRDVNDLPSIDDQSELPRRVSGLSNATDEDDAEELRVDKTRPSLPTRITWLRGGHKVYVTGTPFQWGRKQRLVPAKGEEGVLETTIRVFPGTHHIKFLVDGNMQTSPDLPTTVDFGNNLVNYIEVSGDDNEVRNVPDEPGVPKQEVIANLPSRQGSGESLAPKRSYVPTGTFSTRLPQYLEDFDQPEESPYYKISAAALEKLPTPPTLPGFLSKPILNNTTLIKDDNSVLNMPNHTVLNHLATCSIKNNILSVSATTRYKDKYVTTIVYKPTKR
ncbi:5'-AMP-activated protein kinase beta subunit, interation domain-containing protein [Xylariaceae sp. FL1272]|nr:5'-AMP-activated protein kinase beta subunit, interation domain-containing protein [Xylariaceae sp. FL1272]